MNSRKLKYDYYKKCNDQLDLNFKRYQLDLFSKCNRMLKKRLTACNV